MATRIRLGGARSKQTVRMDGAKKSNESKKTKIPREQRVTGKWKVPADQPYDEDEKVEEGEEENNDILSEIKKWKRKLEDVRAKVNDLTDNGIRITNKEMYYILDAKTKLERLRARAAVAKHPPILNGVVLCAGKVPEIDPHPTLFHNTTQATAYAKMVGLKGKDRLNFMRKLVLKDGLEKTRGGLDSSRLVDKKDYIGYRKDTNTAKPRPRSTSKRTRSTETTKEMGERILGEVVNLDEALKRYWHKYKGKTTPVNKKQAIKELQKYKSDYGLDTQQALQKLESEYILKRNLEDKKKINRSRSPKGKKTLKDYAILQIMDASEVNGGRRLSEKDAEGVLYHSSLKSGRIDYIERLNNVLSDFKNHLKKNNKLLFKDFLRATLPVDYTDPIPPPKTRKKVAVVAEAPSSSDTGDSDGDSTT